MIGPDPDGGGLRVLFLSHWFPRTDADWGGIFVLEQAQALRKLGVDVRVIVAEPMPLIAWRKPGSIISGLRDFAQAATPIWQMQRGVPVAYIPMLTPHPRHWGALAPRSFITSLARWRKALLANFQPQILHAHTAFLDGYPAAWLARQLRVPMVLSEGTGPFDSLAATPAQRRLTQQGVNAAALVLPVSDYQHRAMASAIDLDQGVAVEVLGNGFDPQIFHPSPLPPPSPYRFVWIGRLDENKQPLLLLEAFEMALASRADLRLTLVGDGPLAAAVTARVSQPRLVGKVELLPPMDRRGVAQVLRAHAALVISSRVETFGVVAIEALGSGRPVLAPACGGPEEIIAATAGGLVTENSAAGLAAGMLAIADRSVDPVALASAARERYGAEAVARRLTAYYAEVLRMRSLP
jgi:glycosyltransferase involved in cell wall biosynthesis